MRRIIFEPEAFEQYSEWPKENRKIFDKISKLIEETARQPFKGSGKPEPLKHSLKGYWSRRITDEHRLIYLVSEDAICIISCKYHY